MGRDFMAVLMLDHLMQPLGCIVSFARKQFYIATVWLRSTPNGQTAL